MSRTLAIKYRPSTFDEVVEQDEIKTILQNQIASKDIKNAYLFVGGAGTGKTTCARIFANEVNNHQGSPIEIDGASNNGVDNVREISKQATTRATDCEYKIFIVDECFTGETLVTTSEGQKQIKDIKPKDRVATLTGFNEVAYVHIKEVDKSKLRCLKLDDGREIVSTKNHLYLTTSGWKLCENLQKGDELIDYKKLSKLWKTIYNEKESKEILQQQVSNGISKQSKIKGFDSTHLSDMWKYLLCTKSKQSKENLFSTVQGEVNIAIRKDYNELRIWNGTTETIITKNEDSKSNAQTRDYKQDEEYERVEWHTSSVERETRGQWSIYRTPDVALSKIKRFLGVRTTDTNWIQKEEPEPYTYIIQSRPWLQTDETCNRSGWQEPQMEKLYCKRYKKDTSSQSVRVESVEIYQSRDNEQHGTSNSNSIFLYDLTIKGHPSYFVNNILVHNCHMISNSAWNAMLKLIEEPPLKTIFIFCTTNPEKIPKTILSRVQRYNFKRITTQGITSRLVKICNEEDIKATENDLNYLAKIANGHMRDALTMLDKVRLLDNNIVTSESIASALGLNSYYELGMLFDGIMQSNEEVVIRVIENCHSNGNDLKLLIEDEIKFVVDYLKWSVTKSLEYCSCPDFVEDLFKSYKVDNQRVKKYLGTLIEMKNTIKYDEFPKDSIESWLLLECL